jgi:hypothetical protein
MNGHQLENSNVDSLQIGKTTITVNLDNKPSSIEENQTSKIDEVNDDIEEEKKEEKGHEEHVTHKRQETHIHEEKNKVIIDIHEHKKDIDANHVAESDEHKHIEVNRDSNHIYISKVDIKHEIIEESKEVEIKNNKDEHLHHVKDNSEDVVINKNTGNLSNDEGDVKTISTKVVDIHIVHEEVKINSDNNSNITTSNIEVPRLEEVSTDKSDESKEEAPASSFISSFLNKFNVAETLKVIGVTATSFAIGYLVFKKFK